jgi:hypothetical protein
MHRGSENEERMEVEMADFMSDFKMQAGHHIHSTSVAAPVTKYDRLSFMTPLRNRSGRAY